MCAIFASELYALLLHTLEYGPFISLSLFFFFWNKAEASSCVEWYDRKGKLNSAAVNCWGLGGGLFFLSVPYTFLIIEQNLGGKTKLLLTRKWFISTTCYVSWWEQCIVGSDCVHYIILPFDNWVSAGDICEGVTFCSTECSKAGECSCLLATTQGCLMPALFLPTASAP